MTVFMRQGAAAGELPGNCAGRAKHTPVTARADWRARGRPGTRQEHAGAAPMDTIVYRLRLYRPLAGRRRGNYRGAAPMALYGRFRPFTAGPVPAGRAGTLESGGREPGCRRRAGRRRPCSARGPGRFGLARRNAGDVQRRGLGGRPAAFVRAALAVAVAAQ